MEQCDYCRHETKIRYPAERGKNACPDCYHKLMMFYAEQTRQ